MAEEYDHTPVTVDGKRTVIIGGTSGIGKAIAKGFATEGADVVATSRSEDAVAETADALRDLGAATVEVTCDVTDWDSLDRLFETAAAAMGGLDILVNSVGGISREAFPDVSEEEWQRVLDVQLDGSYRSTQLFAETADGGSIINISSIFARLAVWNVPAYTAAKGGVNAMTRVAARELAPEFRVNAIAPGFTITPLNEHVYGEGTEKRRRIDRRAALGRVASPPEMVGAAVYLASDAATYTTGEVLTVDGGFSDSAL